MKINPTPCRKGYNGGVPMEKAQFEQWFNEMYEQKIAEDLQNLECADTIRDKFNESPAYLKNVINQMIPQL